MYTSRRSFLKKSAITIAGTTIFSSELFAARKEKEILGIQLYSVRDDMKNDPKSTLKQISDIGYKYVEHASYVDRKFYGYTPTEFKKILNDLGLQMKSGHTVMGKDAWDESKNDFTDKWKYTVEDAAAMEQQFVISPSMDKSFYQDYDSLKRVLEIYNKSGELCKQHGMRFGYHNHAVEFTTQLNGMRMYDIILKETDPDLVIQQIDIGNMYGAGGRAIELIKQYFGRFKSMHVKDEIKSEKAELEGYESTELGKGVVQVKEVLELARKTGGTTHFIIEQESYQGKSPIEAVKTDYRIMTSWGFA